LDNREQQLSELGSFHPALQALSVEEQRDFAKQYVSSATHFGKWKPGLRHDGITLNAASELYAKYGIPEGAAAHVPSWFKALARELSENGSDIVHHPDNRPLIAQLRTAHPEKAGNVSSALHYVLAPHEYAFLDACFEYAQSVGLDFRDDCLDGGLWLQSSFPNGRRRDDVFSDMTNYARRVRCCMHQTHTNRSL